MENNPPPPRPPRFPTPTPKPPPPAPNFPPPVAAGSSSSRPAVGPKPLVLPRRISPLQRAQQATQATAEARRSLDAIFSQSRSPWKSEPVLSGSQIDELQKTIRTLESKLSEREMALAEAEAKLGDRERALAEAEALLQARAQLVAAAQKPGAPGGAVSAEHEEALKKLKEELDRQEHSIKEQWQQLQERQDFLDQSEASLFAKMQEQQEKETEQEQREEDLKRLARQAGVLKNEPPEPMEKA